MLRPDTGHDRHAPCNSENVLLAVHIRRGVPSQLAAIRDLLAVAKLPIEDITAAPELTFWIAEDEGALQGVIGCERYGQSGLLRSLAVVPERRRQGLGRALVMHLEREVRDSGIQQLVLLTETAQAFFAELGYSVTHRAAMPLAVQQTAEFTALCPLSATCMTKDLRG